MKAIHIVPVLLLAAAGSAAYVLFRPAAPVPASDAAVHETTVPAAVEQTIVVQEEVPAPEPAPVSPPVVAPSSSPAVVEQTPVQPLEERGDAMLYEIDALQNTPFDEAITRPFD